MPTVLIRPSKVRAVFRAAGKRTPAGFVSALDRFVCLVVDQTVAGGPLASAVKGLLPMSLLTSAHVRQAMEQLEAEGVTENGYLLRRARQLAGNGHG